MDILSMKTMVVDYARPTLYKVSISKPDIMATSDSGPGGIVGAISDFFGAERQINLNCKSASFPSVNINTFEHKTGSDYSKKMPYEVMYDDIDLEFYLDAKHTERNFFSNWVDSIFDPDTKSFAFKEDYQAEIEIAQLDRSMQESKIIRLVNAYPINIGEVQLAYDQMDSVSTFTVTFTYDKWTSDNDANSVDLSNIAGEAANLF